MSELIKELKSYGELLKHTDFEVVTLHPLADETEILNCLSILPNDCISCDLYWVFKENMFFISIFSSKQKNPFVTYHFKPNVKHGHSFYIVTNKSPLFIDTIVVILEYLSKWIISNSKNLLEKKINTEKGGFKITDMDICESANNQRK